MPKKSVLVVDTEPEVISGWLKRVENEIGILHTATSEDETIELIKKRKYDLLIADVMRFLPENGQRRHSTGVKWEGYNPSIIHKMPDPLCLEPEDNLNDFRAIRGNDESINQGPPYYEGLGILASLTFNREVIGRQFPCYLILTDRKRNDGRISLRVAQNAIEYGSFDFISGPRGEGKLAKAFSRLNSLLPFSEISKPQVNVFAGTKLVGKSELLSYLSKYVSLFTKVAKSSSRQPRKKDLIHHDTGPLDVLLRRGFNVSENIHWESYGNNYCILREDIDRILKAGRDCGVIIGQPEGIDSLLNYYPQANIFYIHTNEKFIEELYCRRKDETVPLKEILETRERFPPYLSELERKGVAVTGLYNRTFFDVTKDIYQLISENRARSKRKRLQQAPVISNHFS